MTSHPKRYIGLCCVLLVLAAVAPPVADWVRAESRLPPGYGAEGDRWRGTHMPGPVRATVGERSAGAEASWVKETVEGGAWVYELHVLTGGNWSVVRIAPSGAVLPPPAPAPGAEPDMSAEVDG